MVEEGIIVKKEDMDWKRLVMKKREGGMVYGRKMELGLNIK